MNELEVLKNSLNISIWMLGVTLFMSVGTVTLSALNMAFQRSHNRKSVKPFCSINKSIDVNTLRLSIVNAGLGPMIVQKIVIVKNENDKVKDGVQIFDLLPPELHYKAVVNKNDTHIIPSMGELKLFEISADLNNKLSSIDQLKKILEHSYLVIAFKDVYDHRYEKRESLNF